MIVWKQKNKLQTILSLRSDSAASSHISSEFSDMPCNYDDMKIERDVWACKFLGEKLRRGNSGGRGGGRYFSRRVYCSCKINARTQRRGNCSRKIDNTRAIVERNARSGRILSTTENARSDIRRSPISNLITAQRVAHRRMKLQPRLSLPSWQDRFPLSTLSSFFFCFVGARARAQ